MRKETKSLKSLLKGEFLPLEESAEGVLRGGFASLLSIANNCNCRTVPNNCSCPPNSVCISSEYTNSNCACPLYNPPLLDNCSCNNTIDPPASGSTVPPGSTSKPEETILENGSLSFFF